MLSYLHKNTQQWQSQTYGILICAKMISMICNRSILYFVLSVTLQKLKIYGTNECVQLCIISVKKCFLSPNNGFLRFCQGKTQVPINNYILNSTNRITTVLCQKCLAQQAHIIRASTLHPSSTILLLSYIFLCEQILRKM